MKKIYCSPYCGTISIVATNLLATSPMLPAINDPQLDINGDARIVDFGDE